MVELCSSCTNISFNNIFHPSPTKTPYTHYLGHLKRICEQRRTCKFCAFVVKIYSRLIKPYLEDSPSNASHLDHFFLVSNTADKPWYDAAGVRTPDLPTVRTAWLQAGSTKKYKSRTFEPQICISWPAAEDHETKAQFAYPRKRILNEAFNATANVQLIQAWLDICEHNHTGVCENAENAFERNFLKTKFLDVRNGGRVVSEIGSEPYAALSYVWGRSRTNTDTPQGSFVGQIAMADLQVLPEHVPSTIADAMTLVSQIGLNLLWVDLFCIDQFDEQAKREQIRNMHLIFQCAYLTIIPLDAKNMTEGIAGISRPFKYTNQPETNLQSGRLMATFVDAMWDKQGNSPWDRRAWTLQESLLSRSCLYFDTSHMYMLCGEEFFHSILEADKATDRVATVESNTWYWQNGFNVILSTSVFQQTTYGAFVDNFTRRQLTFQTDALDACRAALTRISTSTGIGFTWGIPIKNTAQALLWQPDPANCLRRRPQFPSWTWLGWTGHISYPYFIDEWEDYCEEATARAAEHVTVDVLNQRPGTNSIFRHNVHKIHEAALQMTRVSSFDGIKILQISSTIACFSMARVSSDATCYPSSDVGIRWTLLDQQGLSLVNEVGENLGYKPEIIFHATDYFCRLSRSASHTIETQGSQAEFLFIKYWPAIRDHHKFNSWRYDQISAILIVKNLDGTYSREALVMMKRTDWLSAHPLPRVIELQ